jgi:hypothetical protein
MDNMVEHKDCVMFTEGIRYASVAFLIFAAWRIWACDCSTTNPAKPLLQCSDHNLQFSLAANLGLILPLLDQFYKYHFHRSGDQYTCK